MSAEIGFRAAYALLKTMQDVCILIHRSPDGDCIGGGYALYRILTGMGIRAAVVCADPIPAVFREITEDIQFEEFEPKVLISVDVADRQLLGDIPYQHSEIALCIDHHISNTKYAEKLCWNPDASAACEVLFYFMQENCIPMTREIALCLYAGMATDTGCFRFSNAGADTFAAVSAVKRAYPDLPYARLNRELFVLKTRGRMLLDARLMQNVRLAAEGKAALIYLPYAWMKELNVSADETDGIANLPMEIIGVEVGITVKQQEDGSFRVSMRAGEWANVSEIAQQFGGGGHIKASGCSFSGGDPEEVCGKLLDTAAEMLRAQEAKA